MSFTANSRLALLAGGLAAVALAAPATVSAATPTDAGRISISDVDGRTHAIWPDGSHRAAEFFDGAMTYSEVGAWHAGGAKVSVINPVNRSAAYVYSDPNTNPVTIPALNAEEIVGSAVGPDGIKVAISSNLGITIRNGGTASNIFADPAGTVVWSGEGANGTIVWDGYATGDSGGGIPGGDPELPGVPTNGEGIGDGIWMSQNGGMPVEIVTEDSASSPSISQDGRIVAWAQTDQMSQTSDIWFMDLSQQSPQPQKLAASSLNNDDRPAVSPDGAKIAFVSGATNPQKLVIGNVSGGAATAVETLETDVVTIAWQPAVKVVAGAVGITGTADVGQMLSANPLTAPSGTAPFVDTFAWEACDDAPADGPDPTCAQVGVGSFYTVKESDRGKRLRLVLTTRNVAGSSTSYSARTAVVPGGTTPSTPTDSTAPEPPSFVTYPALEDPDTTPTFAWVGSEPGGKFQCQIVGGLKGIVIPPEDATTMWEDCTSPYTTPELTEGLHRFRVRHFDDAGNVQSYDEFEWTVTAESAPIVNDTTGPLQPTFTSTPDKLDNDATPTFAWTGAEPGGKFQCRVISGLTESESGTWTDCATPFTTPALTDGFWTIAIRQVDDAGNPGDARYFEYELDTKAPDEVVLMETPFLNTPYPTATFKFNKSDEANTLECRIDAPADETAGGWQTCTSPVVLPNLPNGKHKFEVREVDEAGNAGVPGVWNWIVNAPVIEKPVTEKPVVDTPKPVAETPAAPAQETPAPPAAPRATVAPKAPAFAATIGGTKTGAQVGAKGGTSSSAIIEVAKESVGVGCSITGTVLRSCKVDLYANVVTGTTARAAAVKQVLVGTGTYEKAEGSATMDVRIELNRTGKALLRKSPGGLNVAVKITGRPVSGAPLKATGSAKLVADRASATIGGFAVDSAVLTAGAKRQLRTLAKFGKAATVRCVGHTDASSDDAKYLRTLGARRAKAVCAYLNAHGVKGTRTLVSKGSNVPVSSNATAAGRARNRRVQVTVVR